MCLFKGFKNLSLSHGLFIFLLHVIISLKGLSNTYFGIWKTVAFSSHSQNVYSVWVGRYHGNASLFAPASVIVVTYEKK